MRTSRVIPFSILFLILVFPWAFGQSLPPSLEVFLEGGTSFSNSGRGTETITCPNCPCPTSGCSASSVRMTGYFPETIRPTGGARYRFTRRNALEASFSYSRYHFVTQLAGQPALAGYNRAELYSINYVRYLAAKTRVQPFLTVGLGITHFAGSPVSNGYTNADNGGHLGWNIGGGADYVLERHFALRMELRDNITGQPSIMNGTINNVVPSVGVVFRFR